MANMCMTTIILTGKEEDIERLKQIIEIVKEKSSKREYSLDDDKSKDYDINWAGFLLLEAGVKYEKIINVASFVDYDGYDNTPQDNFITLFLIEKWIPQIDFFNLLAEEFNLEYVYKAIEPGCSVFTNTDIENKFLKEKYWINDQTLRDCIDEEDFSLLNELDDNGNIFNVIPSDNIIAVFKQLDKEDNKDVIYPDVASLSHIRQAVNDNNIFNANDYVSDIDFVVKFNACFSQYYITIVKYKSFF